MKMMEINQLVRENIRTLTPYSSARDEFKGKSGIFLDANENPYGQFNRYPDPYQTNLKTELARMKELSPNNIFIGNGSDEIIDLCIRIFCEPKEDKIIICPPTYGMYKVTADINNVEVIKIPLDNNFQLQKDKLMITRAKVLFLCSPNNPTGNILEGIEEMIEKFEGLVFLDEAYIDFSEKPSLIQKLRQYPNLIISQTLSKAWGKAALRIGIAYASEQIISNFNRVKPPYNVSEPNQVLALESIRKIEQYHDQLTQIKSERAILAEELARLSFVEKVYPTDANFLLIKCNNADKIYQLMTEKNIIIRNRSSEIPNALRITVGSKEENTMLIKNLKELESKI